MEDDDEECDEHAELENKKDIAEVELITDGNDEISVAQGLMLFHYCCANNLVNLAVDYFRHFKEEVALKCIR